MIRSALSISLLLLCLQSKPATGQNLYDLKHSREFATYLMQTRQYPLALTEWQRVLFLQPCDTLAQLECLRAFRLAGEPLNGIRKINEWYPDQTITPDFKREGIKLIISSGDFSGFDRWIASPPSLPEEESGYYQLGVALMRWEGRNDPLPLTQQTFYPGYEHLLAIQNQAMAMKWKSPALSLALSAVIPGLGKVYTGDWKDGIISLLFVATNAWQAYRGFSQKGWGHPYGYIFGSLAVGFYGANLFGSWKSARDHNLNKADQIRHEAFDIIHSRF